MHVAVLILVLLNILVNFYGFLLSCLFSALPATDGFAIDWMFKWEKNEMRKKQIINSTVASGDGSENETKTRRKPFAKQREGKKRKKENLHAH